jgi:hypothetical protein
MPSRSPHAALDLEALAAEEFAEPAGRHHFLITELGEGVDRVRQALELVAETVDGLVDESFTRLMALLRSEACPRTAAEYTPAVTSARDVLA